MKSQKEINLAKDLQLRDRQDIYRNFLLYCMSGDTVALPMGATVVVERDQTEFARLSQLGDILGLQQTEVAHVHSELAEQAYRQQVGASPEPSPAWGTALWVCVAIDLVCVVCDCCVRVRCSACGVGRDVLGPSVCGLLVAAQCRRMLQVVFG